ncbi:MAG: glycosyltransferase [Clostridiales bacterium]|nr:glycosyltransferase [Clostridiales bacterium]
MNNSDLITVIVPVYNVEKFLRDAVASIAAQTYQNIEIILVDDGSTDNSGKICDELKEGDDRIKVIHQKNVGLSGARNSGLDNATGKYVSFIDSDDRICPEMIETLYRGIVDNDADVSCCDLLNIISGEPSKKVIKNMISGVVDYGRYDLLDFFENHFNKEFPVNVCSRMFKLSLINELKLRFVPTQKVYAEDQLFTLCYYSAVRRAYYTPEPLYLYYIRTDSLSGFKPKPEVLNRWLSLVTSLRSYFKTHSPSQPFSTYAYLVWGYILRVTVLRPYDEICEAFSLIDEKNRKFLKKCMLNLVFGKSGRHYAKKEGISGKALLYQKYMWLLMAFGKYEKPIRTNLLSSSEK